MGTNSNKDSNNSDTGVASADSGGVQTGSGTSGAPTITINEAAHGESNKEKASGALAIDPVRLPYFPADLPLLFH